MFELALSFCVASVCVSAVVCARWYFADKKLAREEAAKERTGLPIEVFSRLQDFERRIRTVESKSLRP